MQAGEPMSEEEVILSEPSSEAEAAPEEEEYDAANDEQAHEGHTNAAEEEDDEQEEQEPAAAESQGIEHSGDAAAVDTKPAEASSSATNGAAEQPAAEQEHSAANPAQPEQDAEQQPEQDAGSTPVEAPAAQQTAQQAAEPAASSSTADQPRAEAPAHAAPAAGAAAASAPKGLPGLPARGLGLGGASLPAQRTPAVSPPKADANGTQEQPATQPAPQQQTQQPAQQQEQQAEQQAPAAAKPAGGLSGLGGAGLPRLPARPAKPAGGLSGLPARPGTTSSSSTPSASSGPAGTAQSSSGATGSPQQQQPQQPATSAPSTTSQPPRATPSLPARPTGGLGSLPPRGTAPAATAGARPGGAPGGGATAGGGTSSGARPALPSRPAVASAGVRPGGVVAAAGGAAGGTGVQGAGAPVEVVDPEEPKAVQKQREKLQELRIGLLRAAQRFGMGYQSEVVGSYMAVLDRLEKISRPMAKRRVDVGRLALEEAQALDADSPPDSRLGLKVKVLVIGMTGTGKSALINTLLDRQAGSTNAFRDATRRIRTHRGTVRGVDMTFIDTPGLHASNDQQLTNLALLRRIKGAYKRHKPNFVFYVDRLDAAKAGFGELTILTQISEVLGQKVWRETMVVLTHANAAREQMGLEYGSVSKQRRNIMQNILRQASGEMQLRNPFHLVDTHPQGPRTTTGQPITYDSQGPGPLVPIPWKQQMYVQLLGLSVYEQAQQLLKEKGKPKAGAAAAANKQQDLFKQLMRSRLPPTSFFVEQMVEGVLKPDTWAVVEDPFDAETEDEEAEEFKHVYYRLLYDWAKRGNLWAQKEYAAILRKLGRIKRAYGEAFENEDLEMMASHGYEGYVAEGLDLGITFDPEDATDHRYMYLVPEMDWQIMPTLDYYGYEHEDAITGFVAEWSAQPFNVDGWGGIPVDLTLTLEKDKTTTCVQAETHASIIHSVKPFGSRHITQLGCAVELLRPNVKDVLYTLEANTFRDGLLQEDDHAGAGVMWARMGEGGKIKRGPSAMGYRVQESMALGPFDIEAVAAQVRGDIGVGVKDEGWGARANVACDWVPGLGINLDWYRERTKETDPFTTGGFATNLSYEFDMLDAACGCEIDWVSSTNVVHVDVNIFDGRSWKFAWLLLLPLANYVKETFSRLRLRGGDEDEVVEEEEEEELEDAGLPGAAAGMLGGPDGAAMLQQLLAQGGMRGMMG